MKDVINCADFDFNIIKRFPVLSPGRGRRSKRKAGRKYLDLVCAFDIETTRLPDLEQSIMYIWQFQVDGICTVIGRTWDEYKEFISGIEAAAAADIIVFIHNASYEWQFLKSVFEFKTEDIFALDQRKVLRFKHGKIEYRCSYLQSNMSLKKFTETFGVKHAKLSDFDYEKIRYPWTELSEDELAYCVHDVQGLVEAIKEEMSRDGDTLYTLPLTSTGYVRRDVKKSVEVLLPHDWLHDILPDLDLYDMLLEAFRGGNTHANRYYAGETLKNVVSMDRSSSYPDVQINCKFPVGKFIKCKLEDTNSCKLIELIFDRKKAVLFRCAFSGIRLHDRFCGCPYFSESKVRGAVGLSVDNGRILSALYLETTLTDVDFLIAMGIYEWDDLKIIDMRFSRYGYLPEAITRPTIEYYKRKTKLKGSGTDEYLYMKSKNKLNAVYGMSAQRPVRLPIIYNGVELLEDTGADRAAILEKSNSRAFQSYAWGVWVTAWARFRLQEGIDLVGDNFVYCDTDSVKYIDKPGIEWEQYNQQRKKDSEYRGAVAKDKDGNFHYMGVYELDGVYDQFKTLGAKKYCYTDGSGLHLTLAGVGKKAGAEELLENGGISAFKEGFIFIKGGGTESVYNDLIEPLHITIDGHKLDVGSNVVIRPSTYTLALTDDYRNIIEDAAMYRKVIKDLHI